MERRTIIFNVNFNVCSHSDIVSIQFHRRLKRRRRRVPKRSWMAVWCRNMYAEKTHIWAMTNSLTMTRALTAGETTVCQFGIPRTRSATQIDPSDFRNGIEESSPKTADKQMSKQPTWWYGYSRRTICGSLTSECSKRLILRRSEITVCQDLLSAKPTQWTNKRQPASETSNEPTRKQL